MLLSVSSDYLPCTMVRGISIHNSPLVMLCKDTALQNTKFNACLFSTSIEYASKNSNRDFVQGRRAVCKQSVFVDQYQRRGVKTYAQYRSTQNFQGFCSSALSLDLHYGHFASFTSDHHSYPLERAQF